MLTGDKVETAINIGVSAGLLESKMIQHIIQECDYEEIRNGLVNTNEFIKQNPNKNHALILSGGALTIIESDQDLS